MGDGAWMNRSRCETAGIRSTGRPGDEGGLPGPARLRGKVRSAFLLLIIALVGLLAATALLSPAPALAAFPDVLVDNPYRDAIDFLAQQKVIQGYGDGNFGPSDPVTRQQFAKMIILTLQMYQTLGIVVDENDTCPFPDVGVSGPGDLYPDNYVAEAAARGITVGTGGGMFSPDANISRAQAVTMVTRAVDAYFPGALPTVPLGYWTRWPADFDPVHAPNARRADYHGVLNGLDLFRLDPWGHMTRGEVAQMLHSMVGTVEQRDGVPLLDYWWTAAAGWQGVDIAALTGQKVKHVWMGGYQILDGPQQTRQYILASSVNDDLLSFEFSSAQQVWQATNLSQAPFWGLKLSGPCTVWTTGMDVTKPRANVAGRDPQGNLLHYSNWPGDWIGYVVTNYTGRKILPAPLDSWVTRSGTTFVEHVAAVGLGGEVLVFSRAEAGDWQVVDVSAITGITVDTQWRYQRTTGLRYWGVPSGGTTVDHLVGVTPAGQVMVFWSTNESNWQAVNVSAITGQPVDSLPTPWVTNLPSGGMDEQLAAVGPNGELLRFSFLAGVHDWQAQNISAQLPGLQLYGGVEEWTTTIPGGGANVDHLAGRSAADDLLVVYGVAGSGAWQQVNVSGATGRKMEGPLLSWQTGTMPNVVEHVTAFGRD